MYQTGGLLYLITDYLSENQISLNFDILRLSLKNDLVKIADTLPVSALFTTTVDVQVSYCSDVKSNKSYF